MMCPNRYGGCYKNVRTPKPKPLLTLTASPPLPITVIMGIQPDMILRQGSRCRVRRAKRNAP